MINYKDDMKEKHQSKEVNVEEIEKFDFYIPTGYGSDYAEAEEEYLNILLDFKSKITPVIDDAIKEVKDAIAKRQ